MSQEIVVEANGGHGEVIIDQSQDHLQPQQHIDHIPQPQSQHIEHFEPIHPVESEITFQKRTVPRQRTQSVQSVLSSVSLKSFVHLKNQQMQQQNQQVQQQQNQQQPQQQNGTQAQFINATTHIQAPATAASSKRRASFEIGQRLPFSKEKDNEELGEYHAVESDGEAEITQDEQKNLTDDALKRLGSLTKFTPAEADITLSTTRGDEEAFKPVQDHIDTIIPFRTNSSTHIPSMRPLSAQSSRVLSRNMSNLSPVAQSDIDEDHLDPIQNGNELPHNAEDQVTRRKSPGKMQISLPSNQDFSASPMVATPSSNSSIDNANLKTISDPKRPMYVPAVLRQSNTNLKPEDLKHINEQNSRKSKSMLQGAAGAARSLRTQSSHWSLGFDRASSKSPTRAHWRRDITRQSCAKCDKAFSFFERRHHCRRCGDIFCAEHTSHLLKLGLDAQFTLGGHGLLCKVCDNCCKDYEQFVKRELGEVAVNGAKRAAGTTEEQAKQNNVEGSNVVGAVPADWSWSSF